MIKGRVFCNLKHKMRDRLFAVLREGGKMIMKRTIPLLLTITLIFSGFTTVKAEINSIKYLSDEVARSHIELVNEDFNIQSVTPLYDGTGEINGYWYHLKNGTNSGYMIVFNWGGELKVTEYSFERDLDLDTSRRIYYNGLISYFYGDQDTAILTDSKEDVSLLVSSLYRAPDLNISKTYSSIQKNSIIEPKAYTTKVSHIYGVPKINQNAINSSERSKLCTQTATAMLIQYYDENKSGYSAIATSSGTSLVLDVRKDMQIGTNGTTLQQFRSGLTNYLSSRGFGVSITTKDAANGGYTNLSDNDFNLLYNDMVNDKPAIVVIGSAAKTGSGQDFPCMDGVDYNFLHAMTVIGTYKDSQTRDMYLEVIDPDGGVERTLFWDIEITPGIEPSAIWALSRVTITK